MMGCVCVRVTTNQPTNRMYARHMQDTHTLPFPFSHRQKAWEQEALTANSTAWRSWQIPHSPLARLLLFWCFSLWVMYGIG